MTHTSKKFISTVLAAVVFASASLTTAQTASAGQWQQNHGGHGGGMNNGAAIAWGIASITAAIIANAKNSKRVKTKRKVKDYRREPARVNFYKNPSPTNTVKLRCLQAKEWVQLANRYKRAARKGDRFAKSQYEYRMRKARQARKDCKRWARR